MEPVTVRLDRSFQDVLQAWCRSFGRDRILATVVGVQGSAYRKPGARLLCVDGAAAAGSISGGCIEAEIAVHGWAWTNAGPVVRRFDMRSPDDDLFGYGMGCRGVIDVLIERATDDHPALIAASEALQTRQPRTQTTLMNLPTAGFEPEERGSGAFVEAWALPPLLLVAGAGTDAMPLVQLADLLGWEVTVTDHRQERLEDPAFQGCRARLSAVSQAISHGPDAAVVMTHSFAHDRIALQCLLASPPRYLALLGPIARRERLRETLPDLDWSPVRSPAGLDLGAQGPHEIALSIIAEASAVINGRTASPLCVVTRQ